MRRLVSAVLLATSATFAAAMPAFAATTDPQAVWYWCGHGVC